MSARAESAPTLRLSHNTLTLIVSNLGGAVVLFLLSALLGRSLGSDGLGIYSAALAWVFPLTLLVEFGLATLMTRDIARDLSIQHDSLETATLARLLMGGATLILVLIAAPLISTDPRLIAGLQVSAPLVLISPLFSSFTAVFKARGAMWPVPYLTIGMLLVQLVLTALVLLAGGGVIAALVLNVVTSAGQLVAAWAIYRWKFHSPMPLSSENASEMPVGGDLKPVPAISVNRTSWFYHPLSTKWGEGRQVKSLLRRAFPFALAAFFAALQTRLSLIMLEQLASTVEVGYFSAASRFVEAARTIPNAYFGALFPALAVLAADHVQMARTFRWGLLALAGFGAAAGIGFMLLGLPVVTLTYGGAFAPAGSVLQVLGWSLLFSLPRGGRTLYLYALGQERRVNRVNGAVIVLQGGLSLLLIPAAGAVGVAIVHVLVELAALVLLWRNGSTSA